MFLAGSLSNLVDKLNEETHKIKCKYRHDNKKCEKCKIKCKDCKYFVEYKKQLTSTCKFCNHDIHKFTLLL